MNLYNNIYGHMPGEEHDPSAPWNRADENEDVQFGETDVKVKGVGYFVTIDHGIGTIEYLHDERECVLSRELHELIIDVAKEKLRK